jgi:phage-related protein
MIDSANSKTEPLSALPDPPRMIRGKFKVNSLVTTQHHDIVRIMHIFNLFDFARQILHVLIKKWITTPR